MFTIEIKALKKGYSVVVRVPSTNPTLAAAGYGRKYGGFCKNKKALAKYVARRAVVPIP